MKKEKIEKEIQTNVIILLLEEQREEPVTEKNIINFRKKITSPHYKNFSPHK